MADPNDLKVLQLGLKLYMAESRLLRLRFIALILLAVILVAAGVEPMSVPWVRVALAALFTLAYLATLRFTQDQSQKE